MFNGVRNGLKFADILENINNGKNIKKKLEEFKGVRDARLNLFNKQC